MISKRSGKKIRNIERKIKMFNRNVHNFSRNSKKFSFDQELEDVCQPFYDRFGLDRKKRHRTKTFYKYAKKMLSGKEFENRTPLILKLIPDGLKISSSENDKTAFIDFKKEDTTDAIERLLNYIYRYKEKK